MSSCNLNAPPLTFAEAVNRWSLPVDKPSFRAGQCLSHLVQCQATCLKQQSWAVSYLKPQTDLPDINYVHCIYAYMCLCMNVHRAARSCPLAREPMHQFKFLLVTSHPIVRSCMQSQILRMSQCISTFRCEITTHYAIMCGHHLSRKWRHYMPPNTSHSNWEEIFFSRVITVPSYCKALTKRVPANSSVLAHVFVLYTALPIPTKNKVRSQLKAWNETEK